jgi:hypothetical protein
MRSGIAKRKYRNMVTRMMMTTFRTTNMIVRVIRFPHRRHRAAGPCDSRAALPYKFRSYRQLLISAGRMVMTLA